MSNRLRGDQKGMRFAAVRESANMICWSQGTIRPSSATQTLPFKFPLPPIPSPFLLSRCIKVATLEGIAATSLATSSRREGLPGLVRVDSRVLSLLVLHRALPDLQRMKHKADQALGHREVFCFFLEVLIREVREIAFGHPRKWAGRSKALQIPARTILNVVAAWRASACRH